MHRLYHNPTLILTFAIMVVLTAALVTSVGAAPDADPGINKIYVVNVRDNSFVVSWTTDVASDGTVNYGTSTPPGSAKADTVTSTTTHYVTIEGLTPSTTYYLSVTSDTVTDDNGGAYYSVTTGPTLGIPPSGSLAYGLLQDIGGATGAANAIVYIQLQDNDALGSPGNSQWVSARTDGSGNWSYNLPNIRTADLLAYYSYSTVNDNLRINYQCGIMGNIGENGSEVIVVISADDPWNLGTVQCDDVPNAITLSSFNAQEQSTAQWLPYLGIAGILLLAVVLIRRRSVKNNQA